MEPPSTSSGSSNSKPPAVALLCRGAFDPPTFAHFRMFERARDFIERTLSWRVVEGVMSPCNDLEIGVNRTTAHHRFKMVEMATRNSYWIRRFNFARDILPSSSSTSSTPTSISARIEQTKSEPSPLSSNRPLKYRITNISPSQIVSTKISVSACVPVPPIRNSSEGRSQQYKENLHLQLEEHQKQLLKHIQIDQPIEERMKETEKEDSSSRESSEEGISKKLDDVKGVSVERDAPPEYAVIRKSGRSNKPLREEMTMLEPIKKTPKQIPREPLKPISQSMEFTETRRDTSIVEHLESPYDNVPSLDELLLASTSWAEYMDKCNTSNQMKYQEYQSDEHEQYIKDIGYSSQMSESARAVDSPKGKKKRSWFFMRSKSLKEPSSKASTPSEDESLIRICGADRRNQNQTSPEILWRKISKIFSYKESPKKEKHTVAPPPRKESGSKVTRFFPNNNTKSADNIHRLTTPIAPYCDPMSVSCCDESGGVTLRFRRTLEKRRSQPTKQTTGSRRGLQTSARSSFDDCAAVLFEQVGKVPPLNEFYQRLNEILEQYKKDKK
ncbi:hypothetical protein WR25_13384 [Diploscapter pachys]|uniref:Cytidyltransferase-like domain-containing protein n=1 Tax=Diploscapter pachys TaxID=2018661 RepID=A0A2A2J3A0_9BILA|nr:hypothetical protein WR25_13384 [Diploscapter pachys]